MRMPIIRKPTMLILMVVVTVACACAGDLMITIKQPFKAGGKDYPSGRYEIIADADGDHINLRNLDKNTNDAIQFFTRLSPREGEEGKVVFDRVGNDLYLTEVYIIGMDGFFFQGASGQHKHLVVKEDKI